MALKKTYSAKIVNNQIAVPQRDIDMHPFEEAHIRASWAMNDLISAVPVKPTQSQEHEWLLEYGADYIKQKRAEWQIAYDSAQPAIIEAEKAWRAAESEWNKHAMLAHANGFDPDTYLDARNLTMPTKENK